MILGEHAPSRISADDSDDDSDVAEDQQSSSSEDQETYDSDEELITQKTEVRPLHVVKEEEEEEGDKTQEQEDGDNSDGESSDKDDKDSSDDDDDDGDGDSDNSSYSSASEVNVRKDALKALLKDNKRLRTKLESTEEEKSKLSSELQEVKLFGGGNHGSQRQKSKTKTNNDDDDDDGSDHDQTEHRLLSLQNEMKNLEKDRELDKNMYLREINKRGKTIESLNQKMKDLDVEKKKFQEVEIEWQSRLDEKQYEIEQLQHELNHKRMEQETGSMKYDISQREAQKAKKQYEEAQSEITELRAMCLKFSEQSMSQSAQVRKTREEANSARQEMQKEIDRLNMCLSNQKNSMKFLEQRVQGLLKENQDLETKLEVQQMMIQNNNSGSRGTVSPKNSGRQQLPSSRTGSSMRNLGSNNTSGGGGGSGGLISPRTYHSSSSNKQVRITPVSSSGGARRSLSPPSSGIRKPTEKSQSTHEKSSNSPWNVGGGKGGFLGLGIFGGGDNDSNKDNDDKTDDKSFEDDNDEDNYNDDQIENDYDNGGHATRTHERETTRIDAGSSSNRQNRNPERERRTSSADDDIDLDTLRMVAARRVAEIEEKAKSDDDDGSSSSSDDESGFDEESVASSEASEDDEEEDDDEEEGDNEGRQQGQKKTVTLPSAGISRSSSFSKRSPRIRPPPSSSFSKRRPPQKGKSFTFGSTFSDNESDRIRNNGDVDDGLPFFAPKTPRRGVERSHSAWDVMKKAAQAALQNVDSSSKDADDDITLVSKGSNTTETMGSTNEQSEILADAIDNKLNSSSSKKSASPWDAVKKAVFDDIDEAEADYMNDDLNALNQNLRNWSN